MAEAKVEKLPFFVSDEEKKGLQRVPQTNIAAQVKSAIPEFTDVDKGEVVCSFGLKDAILIYHIYKRDRKEIYIKAHEALANTNDAQEQSSIASNANTQLDASPWWPGTEDIIKEVFADHFKFTQHKVTYYPEVDSWSVIMPEPRSSVMPHSHLEAVVAKLALRVEG